VFGAGRMVVVVRKEKKKRLNEEVREFVESYMYESGTRVVREWYESGTRVVREWYESGTRVVRE